MNFSQRLAQHADRIEAHLDQLLTRYVAESTPDGGPPAGRLAAAIRDASLSGGKRIRPFLVFESAALFNIDPQSCCNAAAAIECVHCYSLVHDDLPSMDNDEMRRGKPTVWKAYDEWTAILAGDALLTLAFEILAAPETHATAETRLALTSTLARASGASGMVQGQALDLAASKLANRGPASVDGIKALQALKTGALIETACQFGALLGQANDEQLNALKDYGSALGLAFQIRDDLLDHTGSSDVTGKATNKDSASGKATLVGLLGLEEAEAELQRAVTSATRALAPFDDKAGVLCEAAKFIAQRMH